MKHAWALAAFLLLIPAALHAEAKKIPDPLLRPRLDICAGHVESARKFLNDFLQQHPNHFRAFLLQKNLTPEEWNRNSEEVIQRIAKGETPKTEMEKLWFAHVLLIAPTEYSARVKDILSFTSSDHANESMRLEALGHIAYRDGNYSEAIQLIESSFKLSQELRPHLVALLVSIRRDDPKYREIAERYTKEIENFDPLDPFREYLRALDLKSRGGAADERLKIAFQQCPTDTNIRFTYANQLLASHQIPEAIQVLEYFPQNYRRYLAEVDVNLAFAYLTAGDSDNADRHIQRARRFEKDISQQSRNALPIYEQRLSKLRTADVRKRWTAEAGKAFVAILLGLLLLILLVIRRQKKMPPKEEIVGDAAVLTTAERNVAVAQPMALLASFSSMNGWNDEGLVKLLLYLQSNGIQATYDRNVAGLGMPVLYRLQVPPDQIDSAEKLLQNYESKKDP